MTAPVRPAQLSRAPYCRHLVAYDLVRTTIANGSVQVRKLCAGCGELFGTAVGQRGMDVRGLRWVDTGYLNPPCARCGAKYTEIHHYLPQAIARKAGENCEAWPTEYLCDEHHYRWHELVTPGLTDRRKP